MRSVQIVFIDRNIHGGWQINIFMWSNIGDPTRELTTYELYKMNGK